MLGLIMICIWFFVGQFDFQRLAFPKQLGILCAAIVVGITVYVLMSLIFNYEDLKDLKDILSRERFLKGKEVKR